MAPANRKAHTHSVTSISCLQTVFQKPQFVIDGFQRGDLDQGEIGRDDSVMLVIESRRAVQVIAGSLPAPVQ